VTITNKVSLKSVMAGNTPIADVPDAPTVSAANVGTSRAYNNGSATVTVTAAATGGTPTTFTATSTPGSFTATGTSPLTVTGLQSATSYTFAVTGTNTTATGPAGTSASITATTVPNAPTIGTFTDGGTGTSGTLSFTAPATGGSAITNYKYSTDSSTYTALSPAQTSSPLSLTGLTAGTYNFSVKAVNANGDSAASSTVSGTVITPTAFDSIATFTGNGTTSTYTFSSIPNTYKSLQIRMLAFTQSEIYIQYNSDSGNNYVNHYLAGYGGSTVAAGFNTSASGVPTRLFPFLQPTSGSYGEAAIIDIIDYASTTKNKAIRTIHGYDTNGAANAAAIHVTSSLWLNTAAISSITVFSTNSANNFPAGSIIALYGIN